MEYERTDHLKPRTQTGLVRPHDLQHWSPEQVERTVRQIATGEREYLGMKKPQPEPLNAILNTQLREMEAEKSKADEAKRPLLMWVVRYWEAKELGVPRGYRSVYMFSQAVLSMCRRKDIAPYIVLNKLAKNYKFIAKPVPAYLAGMMKKMVRENEDESYFQWAETVERQ